MVQQFMNGIIYLTLLLPELPYSFLLVLPSIKIRILQKLPCLFLISLLFQALMFNYVNIQVRDANSLFSMFPIFILFQICGNWIQIYRHNSFISAKSNANLYEFSDDEEEGCSKCNVNAEDSRHCELCQKCVQSQYRHCYLLGRCISENNQGFLLILLLYGLLGSCTMVVIMQQYLLKFPIIFGNKLFLSYLPSIHYNIGNNLIILPVISVNLAAIQAFLCFMSLIYQFIRFATKLTINDLNPLKTKEFYNNLWLHSTNWKRAFTNKFSKQLAFPFWQDVEFLLLKMNKFSYCLSEKLHYIAK